MCDKIIKLASLQIPNRFESVNLVYSIKGISPTLSAAIGNGGNNIPLFLIINQV